MRRRSPNAVAKAHDLAGQQLDKLIHESATEVKRPSRLQHGNSRI